MSIVRRFYRAIKVDDYIPSSIVCMVCSIPIDLTTSHYGRVTVGFIERSINGLRHEIVDNTLVAVNTVKETFFPKKVSGRACTSCFTTLHNTTWRDSKGNLRRAFETLHDNVPGKTIVPSLDEAKPITKGLYAPHAAKAKGKRQDTFYDDPRKQRVKVTLEESEIKKEKLAGFGRSKLASTMPRLRKTGKVYVRVRNGKVRCPNPTCKKLVKLTTDDLAAPIICPKCHTTFHWSV
jgi:hypothetical protein